MRGESYFASSSLVLYVARRERRWRAFATSSDGCEDGGGSVTGKAGNTTLVKELREKTGAGILDCQKALVESGNDIEKAIEHLRQKGLAAAQKKAGRETNEGTVAAYIHPGSRIGVLVEVNCEDRKSTR